MPDEKCLLTTDSVFVSGILFQASSKGIGHVKLQKLAYLTYTELPSDVQNSLGFAFDETWYGKRDPYLDRVLEWLIQNNFVVSEETNVFGEEYDHAHSLSEMGVHSYTKVNNRSHPMVRDAMTRFDPSVIAVISEVTQTVLQEYTDTRTEKLINVVISEMDTVEASESIDFF
jgi:hypothetical protein